MAGLQRAVPEGADGAFGPKATAAGKVLQLRAELAQAGVVGRWIRIATENRKSRWCRCQVVLEWELEMFFAKRFRSRRTLSLAVAGTLIASATLLSAASAGAVETYPRPLNGTVAISGHGYGHGHGMSQWGAYGAATQGLTWQQILGFYSPGTALANLGNPTIRVRLDAVGSGTLHV